MVVRHTEEGFTIAEMIVTLVIMSLFLTLFFQMYFTSTSQRAAISTRATADDIALTNLQKITKKANIPSSTTACSSTTGSPNNPLVNSSATGSIIATNASGGTPTWATAGLGAESLTGTALAGGATQVLKVLYPQGCAVGSPAEIISIVSYGSETVTHASYVN